MQRCLYLAEKGFGNVAPNPMVGSVLVFKEKIISEGYHCQFGGPHAEVNALADLPSGVDLKEATLYVSLEPCSHFGKTPPCAALLVKTGIGNVVIGTTDPNPKVAGRGIALLKQAGINMTLGVLENKCKALNKRFNTFHQHHRPYIILKWAQSLDGFIDIDRNNGATGQYSITQKDTQLVNHQWRSQEQAILVGKHTFNNDAPALTNRRWTGNSPLRMVTTSTLSGLSASHLNAWNKNGGGIVFYQQGDVPNNLPNLTFVPYQDRTSFSTTLNSFCLDRQLQSIIVEGGKSLIQHFIDEDCWDENRVLIGAKSIMQTGSKAPECIGALVSQHTLCNQDQVIIKQRSLQ